LFKTFTTDLSGVIFRKGQGADTAAVAVVGQIIQAGRADVYTVIAWCAAQQAGSGEYDSLYIIYAYVNHKTPFRLTVAQ
jgi:hypothetical protein